MTLRAMESFGHAPTGAVTSADLLSNQWTALSGGFALVDLTGGRKYLYRTANGACTLALDSDLSTLLMGFRFHNRSNTNREVFATFLDGAGALGLLLKEKTSGHLSYIVGTYISPRILTTTVATAAGSDDHWVIKVVFDDVAGSVEFYKNGVLDSSVSGVDTIGIGTECDSISFFSNYYQYGAFGFSDLWVDDATNHGETTVLYRPVDAAGSSADWTATGAGTNEACVDEVPPDDDTTYNVSGTVADLDQLGQTGMDGAVGSVLAVQAHVRARKEAAGVTTMKLGLLHSGTHSQGAAVSLNETYEQRTAIFEDVPGGSGWTTAQFDATEVTYEHDS